MASIRETLEEISRLDGVQVSVLVSDDGLLIESVAKDGSNTESLAAVASGSLRASEMIGMELAKGSTREMVIIFEDGAVFIVPLEGKPAILVVVSSKGANLGKIRIGIKKCAFQLARLI
ncbi:roadblock/LC7 domain-containing protein [Dictyoglomus thermophilum]|uniref:Roadblock/LC7 domain superfamily n=1 Tax=Dictyoglomus thermophilum (strain ATCC 35947 / DSM 3960 / H-6-12) TaxID=309799 RepID=B5YE96_DICT6|nr:roadblock/LC7 domain-containing protein [Dictyoglomus thermophilum]ACI19336.1 roadblock/LC7 domain superfamily [Dictyoglomus thermophilum H-6-12]MCX7721002.1 roadblock/LC7 domain-containing protein [Dictyoglomus thermophilum]